MVDPAVTTLWLGVLPSRRRAKPTPYWNSSRYPYIKWTDTRVEDNNLLEILETINL